ncbi:MAG: hypothetical protein ABIP94_12795 [Planctomycetota bacterium]
MRLFRHWAVAIGFCTWSLPAQSRVPLQVPLAEQVPELADLSSWQQRIDARGEPALVMRRGAFVVGNGRVFGCFGLADRAATVQALTGPDYRVDDTPTDGLFGEQRFVLMVQGRERELPRQTVARVRGANFVVSEDRSDDDIALVTLSFANPDAATMYRVVVVRNGSGQALEGAELVAEVPEASADGFDDVLFVDHETPKYLARARFSFVGGARRDGRRLVQSLGTIEPRRSAEAEFLIQTYLRDASLLWVEPAPTSLARFAAKSLDWWHRSLAGTTTVKGDDARLVDLLEDGKVQLLAQRCAASGVIGSVLHSRLVPLQELPGPLLACLRYGLFDDARSMLQALRRATYGDAALPALPEALTLGEPLAEVMAPADAKIAVGNDGRASLVVLLHHWYWRSTGDTALIRQHLPLLLACLENQQFSPEGLQPFASSEPYLADAWRTRLGDALASAGLVPAQPEPGKRALSMAASVQFLLANAAMSELSEAVEREDHPEKYKPGDQDTPLRRHYVQRMFEAAQVTERYFWQPKSDRFAAALLPPDLSPHPGLIADVALSLPWLGWTFASRDRSRHHVVNTLKALWRAPDETRVGLSSGTGMATGVTQSLLLYALADGNDPAWRGAFAELLRQAGPAGNWSARGVSSGWPTASEGALPHADANATGVAIDTIFFALTGMRGPSIAGWDNRQQARFRPRLPTGMRQLEIRDMRRDGRHLHMLVSSTDPLEEEKDGKHAPGFRCRIEIANPPADELHIVCAVNVGAATLVRYLAQRLPVIDDTVALPVDTGALYPSDGERGAGR